MTKIGKQSASLLLALVLQSSLLFSTATVSGNLKDLTGANVSTRTFVRFRLAGCSYQAKASGVALVTPYEKDFTPAADGSISGTLYRNDTEISCLDQLDTTWYEVTVYRDGKPQKPTPYRVAAATFNLNTAAPMTITNVPAARDAVVVNPTALQTINTHPLAFGAGAGISATYQGTVQPSGTYLRSNGSLFAPVSSSQLASDIVSSPSLNGVAYWNSSALSTTPTGGAGTLCLVSTNGGTPAFSSCAGSASTAWSALSAPSANLNVSMEGFRSTLTWTGLASFGGSLLTLEDNSSDATQFLSWLFRTTNSNHGGLGIIVPGTTPEPSLFVGYTSASSIFEIRKNATFTQTSYASRAWGGCTDGLLVKPSTSFDRVATTASTSDTSGPVLGICQNEGLDGIAVAGIANCVFDNATTRGNYVTVSSTVAGNCHDAGSTLPPAPLTVIGRVVETGTAGSRPVFISKQQPTNTFSGTVNYGRFRANQGTALTAADFVISAAWGNTATISAVTGTDSAWQVTVTANGTGIASNPTITLTFKDGAFANSPYTISKQAGGTGGPLPLFEASSTTALTITAIGTPSAGQTFEIRGITIGR